MNKHTRRQKKAILNPLISQQFNSEALKSVRTRVVKETANNQRQKRWTPRLQPHRDISRKEGAKTGPKLFTTIISNRNAVPTIMQLQTGYFDLNYYLLHFGMKNTP